MDNLTHALTGALIARTLPAGWNGEPESDAAADPDAALARPGRWLAPAAVVAANLPDFEALILWPPPLGDKAAYLLHHRGWSHSLVGIAGEALLFAGLLWLICRWMSPERKLRPTSAASRTSSRPVTGTCRTAGACAPGSNGGFFAGFTPARGLAVAALGAFSHLFLDWWNSYGVRPFYPWDKSWYYGDLVFIVDPWVWLMLGGGLVCGTRRFGRSLWWWYALTSAVTLVVAGACWKEQCPWWVLVAWLTGVAEIVLLRWWGRWRAAPAIGWGLLTSYLFVAVGVTDRSGEEVARLANRHTEQRVAAVLPVAGVPWRRLQIVSAASAEEDAARRFPRPGRYSYWFGRVVSAAGSEPGGGPAYVGPTTSEARHPLDRVPAFPQEDAAAVRAWLSFARLPLIVPGSPSGGGRWEWLDLGDARYRLGGRGDWSSLRVRLPPD